MTDRALSRRAEALGVAASYLDWRKRTVHVPARTLAAIIDVLGDPADFAPATADAGIGATTSATGSPAALPALPDRRRWGFTVQLYSVRSRRSWGHGDLRDLADLARWSAAHHGADFILINPLHAAEPTVPVSDSPYLPMSRRYTSPLYLRIEDVAEYQRLTSTQLQYVYDLADPLRATNVTPDLIDRDQVWTAKRGALELIHRVRRSGQREAAYRRFCQREGHELASWATWCALAELHGPDWRDWPAELADPRRAARLSEAGGPLADRAEFHSWLQWLVDEQLAEAQRAARAAGMAIGVIGDLAVGVHPGGADAWAHQDLLVRGMSVGAPPDGFNQRGQDWAQPPWHPQRLAALRARPLADLLRVSFRHAGGLRADHVMGLMRLWWVPDGMSPDRGAYVSYDHRLMVGALTREAARAGALAIGEDLGTVDPWIRAYLASQHVLGTEMLWFAREADGSPLRPEHWRRDCMATVGTHDVPPVSGFVTGDQVTVRARLGLLTDPEAERMAAEQSLSAWQTALVAEGLLRPGQRPTPAEYTVALYGYLARTPATLVGVALADAVGERRTQNIPGTSREYPNWRVPLCDGEGKAVLVEDLPDIDLVRAVASAVASA
ncbi:MAG TPA: 4-alpha-glucanotransferase [Streptosporangiaceae bacterium]